MGIHDREYARQRHGGGFGRGSGSGFGRKRISVNTWLIVVCVVIFALNGFTLGSDISRDYALQHYSGMPASDLGIIANWLYLSTDHAILGVHYWRFIGFQFIHANLQHLLFNMIGLYFFGPMVEQYLGGKRYLAFYLLCGIFGAVLYLFLNLGGYIFGENIPGLLSSDTARPLVGASAGVFGILLAGAYLAPKVKVLVFFIIPMRLSTMAYLLVAFAVFTVAFGNPNAGGEAAHLGGAAAGWYFIRNPHHLNGFFDFLGKADPTSKHFAWRDKGASQGEVDRILDKIHKKGLQSLTTKEKKILHDASRKGREDV